jgi:hypothetical protein
MGCKISKSVMPNLGQWTCFYPAHHAVEVGVGCKNGDIVLDGCRYRFFNIATAGKLFNTPKNGRVVRDY